MQDAQDLDVIRSDDIQDSVRRLRQDADLQVRSPRYHWTRFWKLRQLLRPHGDAINDPLCISRRDARQAVVDIGKMIFCGPRPQDPHAGYSGSP